MIATVSEPKQRGMLEHEVFFLNFNDSSWLTWLVVVFFFDFSFLPLPCSHLSFLSTAVKYAVCGAW